MQLCVARNSGLTEGQSCAFVWESVPESNPVRGAGSCLTIKGVKIRSVVPNGHFLAVQWRQSDRPR